MAPFYKEGVSDPADWPAQPQHPAPWGEVGSSKFDIASPHSSLESIADPRAVMGEYWDRVLDLDAYMANIDPQRPYPQRMQHDVDISNGYMHSGWVAHTCPVLHIMPTAIAVLCLSSLIVPSHCSYPFMTGMDVIQTTLDPSAVKWGICRAAFPACPPRSTAPNLLTCCCVVAFGRHSVVFCPPRRPLP